MKVGSLCTGYGGLEMAVQSVFGSTNLRFVSDIDKDVNRLLTHHHPNVPNLGDLTKINWDDVEQVDLLCAGYPCQPFSFPVTINSVSVPITAVPPRVVCPATFSSNNHRGRKLLIHSAMY